MLPLSITVSSDNPDHCADKWSSLMNKEDRGRREREGRRGREREGRKKRKGEKREDTIINRSI